MEDSGEIVSCDIFEEKIKKIREGAKRLNLSSIRAMLQDATAYREDFGLFDRVLCDAPCSGIGIIGRKPEIKYKDQKELLDLPAVQAKILDQVSRYVKQGGRLIYSTCTLLQQENAAVVEQFLHSHPEFVPCPLPKQVLQALHREDGWQATLLGEEDTDGFFIASMQRV